MPTLQELKAAKDAAEARLRSLEGASQELTEARRLERETSNAYYRAERRETFAQATARLIGRTIVSVEHGYGDAPMSSKVYRGYEVRGLELVLDDGTRISADTAEGDDCNILIEVPQTADAVDPHAGITTDGPRA